MKIHHCLPIVIMVLTGHMAYADDKLNKESDKNFKEYQKFDKEEKSRKEREDMRDKSHDNRYKVGKDASVGVDKDGVNFKKTTP